MNIVSSHPIQILHALPFLGVLLSLVLGPLCVARFWHRYEKWVLGSLTLTAVSTVFYLFDVESACHLLTHTLWGEYVPFLCIAYALYTVSCGVHVNISQPHLPSVNVLFILTAASTASIIGTTGASMLFIRPLLNLNKHRLHKTHLVIFFIIIVSNIAGSLTPLGDPPLFLGYLLGVPFWWPLMHLSIPFLLVITLLLAMFYGVDRYYYSKDPQIDTPNKTPFWKSWTFHGKRNLILLALVMIFTATYKNMPVIAVGTIAQIPIELKDILFVLFMVGIGMLSQYTTDASVHHKNQFHLGPVHEVGYVFFAIFITLIPAHYMLTLGMKGPLSPVIAILQGNNPQLYFWLTGFFSSFLDNAPTYLVFVQITGINIQQLITDHAPILKAISLGAVYMGAMTYIGNAPNLMVLNIAKKHCIPMPNFIVYTVIVSMVLMPIFILVSILCM